MPLSSLDLASFVASQAVAPAVAEAAVPAILDTLGVMVAGSIEPVVARLAAATQIETAGAGFPAIGQPVRYRGDDAARHYGTAAHALDYDDVSMLAICHPSAPVLGALLAARPWADVDGRQLVQAFVIGTEVMVRMGQAIGLRHYEIGYHSTATLGLFGAVSAVARLRGLDAETSHVALAIAASMAGGLRLNFGTDVKPLHVGLAAANAVHAADWAEAGLTASRADLFSPEGMLATLSARPRWSWMDTVRLGEPFAVAEPGFERKLFPGCYLLHKVMALGMEIAQLQISLDAVSRIEVMMPRGATRPLIYPAPVTGREAQFSVPYALLAAIADGEVTFSTFTDEAVSRPALRRRLGDVGVSEEGAGHETSDDLAAAPVRVVLHMIDRSVRSFERSAAPGSAREPMSPAQDRAKWIDCLRRANPELAPAVVGEVYDRIAASLLSSSLGSWLPDLWQLAARPNIPGK